MIFLIQILCAFVLFMILACLFFDERKSRLNNMRMVKLKGYWDGSERRSEERFDVDLPVRYYLNGNGTGAKGMDISAKGIRLLLDEKFEKDAHLRLEIKITGHKDLVRARGIVAWSSEAKEESGDSGRRMFNTGIRFTQFYNDGEKQLFDFITHITNTR